MCTGIQACSDYTKEDTTGRKLNLFCHKQQSQPKYTNTLMKTKEKISTCSGLEGMKLVGVREEVVEHKVRWKLDDSLWSPWEHQKEKSNKNYSGKIQGAD